MKYKSVLVTGGAGFIGSHTCLKLLENNYEVIIIDSFTNSSKIAIEKILSLVEKSLKNIRKRLKVYDLDIRDEEKLNQIFLTSKEEKKEIIGVIHFAGFKSISESMRMPIEYWHNNLNGSVNLLKCMQRNKCKTIIFSSSASIYENTNILIGEKSIRNPTNPYANTKNCIEIFLNDIYKSFPGEWRIANLRYFNPIGAHYSGEIGESLANITSNIFPMIGKVACQLTKKVFIYGNDWPSEDGTCIRDYIHIMDLAEGHLLTLNYLLNNNPRLINLNLGRGKGISVLELIKTFEKVNNVKIPYTFTERRIGDNFMSVADNKLSYKILGWYPKRDLNEMCKDGWKWFKNYPNGY